MLLLQMFQQQQAVLKDCREYSSSSLHTNYAAPAAEYISFLSLLLLHSASSLKVFSQHCLSSEQFLLSLSYKKNHMTCLASSSVKFTDDRESHLQLYINWLKIQSSSLNAVFKWIFHALNKEHYSLKTVQKWTDKKVYWIKLDVSVKLDLQIADKNSIKNWWYTEECYASLKITVKEMWTMTLNAIDLNEMQR